MSALDRTPENINLFSTHNFRFMIKKLPTVNFFCQSVVIPSIRGGEIKHGSPFSTINTIGDRLEWGALNVTFKVDEDLQNYQEIYDWLTAINYHEEFIQYKNIANIPLYTGEGLFSDAVVMAQTNIKNFNKNFIFKRCFPIAMSELTFSSTNNSVQYMEVTATFSYLGFYIESV